MRLPVKLNEAFWSNRLFTLLLRHNLVGDPRLTIPNFTQRHLTDTEICRSISCFRIGSTFKSTKRGRHSKSDTLLLSHLDDSPVILDIGASNGITSVDLMERIDFRFRKYYVTDRNLYAKSAAIGTNHFFFDSNDDWILVANKFFVGYPQHSRLVRRRFKSAEQQARSVLGDESNIRMVHPQLVELENSNPRIEIRSHDLFHEWAHTRPTVIKVANLLNRAYFDQSDLIRAKDRLLSLLPPAGLLLVVDNRAEEASSLFSKQSDTFRPVARVGAGCESEPLLTG